MVYEFEFNVKRATTAKPVLYKIDENECWICISHYQMKSGYYSFQYQKKKTLLHRLIYCLSNNIDIHTFPSDIVCRHKCDNPSCVNPEHIELGSQKDNIQDIQDRGRFNPAKGEKSGRSKISDATVLEIFDEPGSYKELSDKYGVSLRTINRIKSKKTRCYLWEE